LRSLYVLIGMVLILATTSAYGSRFTAEIDVDTYVDAENANQSFSEDNLLWATSVEGNPAKEVYISFINTFGASGIFNPEKVDSATLKLLAAKVGAPGEVKAYLIHEAVLDATWNDKPIYNTSDSVSLNIDKEGEYILDVTPLIKKAVETCTEGCPYSIALVAEDNASIGFASKESQEGKPVLEYTTPE
jgi:hypothetical protein